MAFIVGLTGGIGSGKSVAAQFFAELGVPIIDADLIARELVEPNTPAYQAIIQHFGTAALQSNQQLNRAFLRKQIFADPHQKKWLEDLLHPAIHQEILKKISELNYPYCVVVIPLLAEHFSLYEKTIHHVLVIEAPPAQQLERIIQRDHCPETVVQNIIAHQASPLERHKIAHSVVQNEGTLSALKTKIKDLHTLFLKDAALHTTP